MTVTKSKKRTLAVILWLLTFGSAMWLGAVGDCIVDVQCEVCEDPTADECNTLHPPVILPETCEALYPCPIPEEPECKKTTVRVRCVKSDEPAVEIRADDDVHVEVSTTPEFHLDLTPTFKDSDNWSTALTWNWPWWHRVRPTLLYNHSGGSLVSGQETQSYSRSWYPEPTTTTTYTTEHYTDSSIQVGVTIGLFKKR